MVIVSLTRNNKAGKIGFVATTNRANVLLSRAQHGMYLVGNAETFRASGRGPDGIWARVLGSLEAAGRVGDTLTLVCSNPNHPPEETRVTTAEDFGQRCRDGGCSRRCGFPLACGHGCPRLCHPDNPSHTGEPCRQPCAAALPCGHACPLRCHASTPDHSAVACREPAMAPCARGHLLLATCGALHGALAMPACATCAELKRLDDAERARALREQQALEALRRQVEEKEREAAARFQRLRERQQAMLEREALELQLAKAQARARGGPRKFVLSSSHLGTTALPCTVLFAEG